MSDMRKFINIVLNEAPIAHEGDYLRAMHIVNLSEFIYERNWDQKGKISIDINGENIDFEIIRHKEVPTYMIGALAPVIDKGRDNINAEKNEFVVILRMEMTKVEPDRSMGYPNMFWIHEVVTKKDVRGLGLARKFYGWLVKSERLSILGDKDQYFGARKLWASLSKTTDVEVDVVDYRNKTVISRGAILHQGNYDQDFDKEVWSYNRDKEHIRLILRDVL